MFGEWRRARQGEQGRLDGQELQDVTLENTCGRKTAGQVQDSLAMHGRQRKVISMDIGSLCLDELLRGDWDSVSIGLL